MFSFAYPISCVSAQSSAFLLKIVSRRYTETHAQKFNVQFAYISKALEVALLSSL